jgi:hypothetical protein
MNSRVRVIRFARVTEPAGLADGEIVARVWLDESVRAIGLILRTAAGWCYQLEEGSTSLLASSHSRHDLERQIVLYHLGSLPATDAACDQAPKNWLAATG